MLVAPSGMGLVAATITSEPPSSIILFGTVTTYKSHIRCYEAEVNGMYITVLFIIKVRLAILFFNKKYVDVILLCVSLKYQDKRNTN